MADSPYTPNSPDDEKSFIDYDNQSQSPFRESDKELDLSSLSLYSKSKSEENSLERLEMPSSKNTPTSIDNESEQYDKINSSAQPIITHMLTQSDDHYFHENTFHNSPGDEEYCSSGSGRTREKIELKGTLNSRDINYGNGTKNHFQRAKTGLKKLLKFCKDRDDMMKSLKAPGVNIRRYMLSILAKSEALKIKKNFTLLKKFLKKPIRPNTWKSLKDSLKTEIPEFMSCILEIMSELLFGSEGADDYRDWMDNNRMNKNMILILQSVEYERLFRSNMKDL